jgi:hypothetical protein
VARRTVAQAPRSPDQYYGVFPPASPDRQRAMTWAQRLKRVLAIGRDAGSVDPAHPSRAPRI